MRSHSYINSVRSIIDEYDGTMPLAAWLKQFFRTNKKFGSKDRKIISHACYCYHRLGNAFAQKPFHDRLLIAVYLCSTEPNLILQEQKPEWNERINQSPQEKINDLDANTELTHLFPFKDSISNEINITDFNLSFLIQPDLFLRIRPNRKYAVIKKLDNASIPYELLNENAIRLSNSTKIEDILVIDEDVVIQDLNSQKVLDPLHTFIPKDNRFSFWDCCAASGGKSILLHDEYPLAQITVSDVRDSIIVNLRNRFKRAGITNYHHFVADISSPIYQNKNKYNLIICDAPCSGSGTWGRTPEQLRFFKAEKINHYQSLQKKIAANAAKSVKPQGYFLYITCSVFTQENEEVVQFIQKETGLQLNSMHYFKGYNQKADTLFAALFNRES